MINLTPAQEPVAWYGALGILLNAILVALFIFSPRDGVSFSGAEQGAVAGIVNGIYLVVGAVLTRQAVTPTAPAPVAAPKVTA
jgi:hypothetical protein